MECTHWKLKGSAGEPIHGSTHQPEAAPNGVILIGHGFKGYKDYGMFPWLANQLAEHGLLVHRFNYSHSGMLAQDGPFERPDLFELDTWNRQVEDLTVLTREFHIEELPLTILGHSRGGVACLLAAGRGVVQVDRVISLSAPATCNPLTSEMQETLLSEGFLESPSSRTSQLLRIGKCFLQEQLDDPPSHDLLALVGMIEIPILLIHGDEDPTVPMSCATMIEAVAKDATATMVPNADHVFNTPNPFSFDAPPSVQLAAVWDAIREWLL